MPDEKLPRPRASKHFSTSIMLWVRTDQPRQTGMDYWRGPHSTIIAKTPGLHEYRQLHLAEDNPGRWPAADGVQTRIPTDRRIDGVAEVTFESALAPLAGRAQTALAYADEINVFRRTLLYGGTPGSSRWYEVGASHSVGSRALVYLRRREGVSMRAFQRFLTTELVPTLLALGTLRELRTQAFLPWVEKLWDTPHVAHDNPTEEHVHASVIVGFEDDAARDAFFEGGTAAALTPTIAAYASAIHAYDMSAALTYVRDGVILDHYED